VDQFLAALDRLPIGYSEGRYAGHRWGVTLDMAADRRRCWLWGEQLGGTGRVSFNLYRLAGGPLLRPCEMPAETVIAFVLAYRPDPDLITPPRPAVGRSGSAPRPTSDMRLADRSRCIGGIDCSTGMIAT